MRSDRWPWRSERPSVVIPGAGTRTLEWIARHLCGQTLMPLFVCENKECETIENTAVSNYWARRSDNLPVLCSQCDPTIGQWHGHFPRGTYDPAIHGPRIPGHPFIERLTCKLASSDRLVQSR